MTTGKMGNLGSSVSSVVRRAALLAAASTAMLGSFAQADTVTYSASVPMTKTDWTSVVNLPKFDGSLGTLLSVQFSLSGTNQTVTRVENRDAIRWRVTTGSDVTLGAQSPTLNLVSVAPSIRFDNNLQAFDGTIDYAGTSGVTNPQSPSENPLLPRNHASRRSMIRIIAA
jgi:hypothetical protein